MVDAIRVKDELFPFYTNRQWAYMEDVAAYDEPLGARNLMHEEFLTNKEAQHPASLNAYCRLAKEVPNSKDLLDLFYYGMLDRGNYQKGVSHAI